ncbi:MAG: hypothetical protein GF381_01490 [Candidatus Pacebacteria bacterium]|nr:hypothetical protein [Candidatus Paceibacterota bacterium]
MSEEKGEQYVETLEAMEVAREVEAEVTAELDTPAHEKLLKMDRMSISDLETLLNKALADSEFTRLSFDKPEIDRQVIIPFTLQETKPKRRDRNSIKDLYKLLKETLDNTNWRAPKNKVNCRLGVLTGQLKGYESEEDLLKLFGKEDPKTPKSKLDPEFRAKYEHHNLVQLARLGAEFKVKERIRTRRLKDEPDGFYLNDGGEGYSCGICGNSHDGEDIWWRPDGLRCRDCWRNIQEGVVPVLNLNRDKLDFIKEFELKSDYGIPPATRGKMRRNSELIGRDLKYKNGRTYCTVYLKEENKFLEKRRMCE